MILFLCRFFLYVFLAAVAVLLLVGAQQVLASFGVSGVCTLQILLVTYGIDLGILNALSVSLNAD